MRIIGRIFLGGALLAGSASGMLAQEVSDWSGFYASVYAGYALDPGVATATSSIIPPTPSGGDIISGSERAGSTRIDGLFGGVGAGYNHQINQFILGIDGAVHMGSLAKGTYSSTDFNFTDGVESARILVSNDLNVNVDWYSTLAGTFGVAFDQGWLMTLKGGVAFANISSDSRSSLDFSTTDPAYPAGIPIAPGSSATAATSSQFVMGPTFGLGVAKKVTENVSVGAEYAFVGLPTVSVPTALLFLPGLGGGGTGSTPVDLGFHTVKASLKYHF